MLSRWLPKKDDWRERFAEHAAKAPEGPLQRFYHIAPPEPERPLGEVSMISIDLETTGLDPEKDSIISIGMVEMDIAKVYCKSAVHWIFKPDCELSSTSVPIHEITDSDIRGAPPLESRFGEILNALAGKVVVVHFAPIERRFLATAARRIHGYPVYFPIIDTMDLERRYYQRGLRGLLTGTDSLRLDACRTRLHLPRYKAHHALTDALATAELLQAQVAHRYKPSDPVSRVWI